MRILDDGTVEIKNKRTGATKIVQPNELPSYGIPYSKYQQESTAYKEAIKGEKEPTAEEKKAETKYEDVLTSLNLLEKNLTQAEQRGPLVGKLGLWASKLTGGGVAPEIADFEALRKGLIGPMARAISGEVGVLTDKDIARAEGLLPKVTDNPELAKRKLENIRELISQRTGREETMPTAKMEDRVVPPSRTGGILGGILGGAGGLMVGGPVGAGLGATAGYLGGGATQEMIEDLLGRQQEKPLESVKEVAKGGVKAGLTGYSIAQLLGLVGAGKEFLKKGGIKGTIGKSREVAAKEAQKISGGASTEKIIKAGEKYVKADPTAVSIWEKVKSGLGERLTVQGLQDKLEIWNKAYTAASKVGKSARAGLYNALKQAGTKEMARIAPEVAKQTQLFRYLYQGPKTASKLGWQAVKASGLLKLLGVI